MYLHLGNKVVVPAASLITIINMELGVGAELKEYIENAKLEGRLVYINDNYRGDKKEKQRSFIICEDKSYISPISAATLSRRARTSLI